MERYRSDSLAKITDTERYRSDPLAKITDMERYRSDSLAEITDMERYRSDSLAEITDTERYRSDPLAEITDMERYRSDPLAEITDMERYRSMVVALVVFDHRALPWGAAAGANIGREPRGRRKTRREEQRAELVAGESVACSSDGPLNTKVAKKVKAKAGIHGRLGTGRSGRGETWQGRKPRQGDGGA